MKSKVTVKTFGNGFLKGVLLETETMAFEHSNNFAKDQFKVCVQRLNRLLSVGHRLRGDVCVF